MLQTERGLIPLELLAPAKDVECGLAAINHGADAVYIGAPKFGARKLAGNSLDDIARLTEYAHLFNVRVYIALNTLLYDDEIAEAEQLIHKLYEIGVDAIIVQDMGILQMNLPPIPLHASTQTDNRTPQKVKFLEDAGIQQVVLARELSLEQIRNIRKDTTVPLEFFVHGALCVSYSGQCYMSHATCGRSANRGECSQPCRLPYNLETPNGEVLVRNSHLLSLKDLNLSNHIQDLIDAGITSFKIEGRLKDATYVKNTTAYYRQVIDKIINESAQYERSSVGLSVPDFIPSPEKTFSRGFTTYFFNGRQQSVWSMQTPKSLGEKIGKVLKVENDHFIIEKGIGLNNGDGLCFIDRGKKLSGFRVNVADRQKIFADNIKNLYAGATIFRNHDQNFEKKLENSTTVRKIDISVALSQNRNGIRLSLKDVDGFVSEVDREIAVEIAQKPDQALEQIKQQLLKWGNTVFMPVSIKIETDHPLFIPVSLLNGMRRELAEKHYKFRQGNYTRQSFTIVPTSHTYPESSGDYSLNVINRLAKAFYQQHGIENIFSGFEICIPSGKNRVMTTRHCIRYATNRCPKENPGSTSDRLILKSGRNAFELKFDCVKCEMQVYSLE
jgi:23S rRNA 5-hydroxycytidine C2501 synthase